MRLSSALPLLVLTASSIGAGAQTASTDKAAAASATPDAVKRDELIKPGLEQMRKGDPAAALAALRPALEAYPNDAMVLSLSAQAATASHQDAVALGYFRRALLQNPPDPWHMRVAILMLEARLGQWDNFNRDQAALKQARLAGEKELASTSGYLVDEFEVDGRSVKAAYFPVLAGPYKTLYRFLLPAPPTGETPPAVAQEQDHCSDPNFKPYVDVESDDVDQASFAKQHADLAARGERSYSLDTYPAACSQGLIKFYPGGEPKYETVRADVIKYLQAGRAR